MDTVLGALAFICLMVIIMHLLHDREEFTSSDALVYRVDMSKDTYVIYDSLRTDMKQRFISKFPSFRVTSEAKSKAAANAFICDVFEAQMSRLPLLTTLPYRKHVFICTANNKLQTIGQVGSGVTLYVTDASSRAIANAMFERKVTIKEVSSTINDTMTTEGLIMIYDTVDNATRRMANLSAPLVILDYDKPPEHWAQSKVSFPYLYTEDVDVNIIFKDVAVVQKQRFPMRKVWTFDLLLTAHHNGPEHELYNFVTQEALRDEFAKTNYYSMFLSLHIVTKTYLQRYNAHISKRDDLPILEQYTDTTYEARRNVPGHLEGDVFRPREETIEGVPLIEGMLFTLRVQDRIGERGVYVVKDGKLIRRRRLGQETEGPFRCYGNANAKTQKECESPWDAFGLRKPARGIWDRPCVTDDECPFYQANKEYSNYRGGCLDGLCEMPIGVRRTSYRTFDKTSKPFCHNCPPTDPTCCDGKGDIAFDMDVHERRMHST
jgi:hypothetical protein